MRRLARERGDSMLAPTIRRNRRLVLGAFTLLSLGAVTAEEVVVHAWSHSVVQELNDIVGNALPSMKELGGIGANLRALAQLEQEVLIAPPSRRPEAGREIEVVLGNLDRGLASYEALPTFPGEVEGQARLGAALDSVRSAARSVPAALDGSDELGRRVSDATARADEVVQTLIMVNAKGAADAADAIIAESERVRRLSTIGVCCTIAGLLAAAWALERRLTRLDRETADRDKEQRIVELDNFAARVAHELKGPLSPAIMAVSLLRRSGTLESDARRAVDVIERSHARVIALVDGLLAFARTTVVATAGHPSSVEEVAQEILPALQALAREERAELRFEVEPGLRVGASRVVLGSILDNLVRNALLYLGDGEVRRVTLRATSEGPRALFEIRDTGPGIPSEVLVRLFRPFERASARPGSGLGLATVKRFVEALGGETSVRSRVGEGSTFVVRLPRSS
jgi:signal transduction histidine kinase